MNIGKSIKYGLVRRDMMSKDLAAELGVTPTYISLLSKGTKKPSSKLLSSIAIAFGMSVSEFIALGEEKAA